MVSRMMSSLPCIPQVAHTDFDVSVCRAAKSKPFIAFAPVSNEGCMLLVWTKEKYTGKDEKEYFCHFYVYIPHGSICSFLAILYMQADLHLAVQQEKNIRIIVFISIFVMVMVMMHRCTTQKME